MPRWTVPALALALAGAVWGLMAWTALDRRATPPHIHEVPNFSLTESSGRTFGRGDMAGTPWVVNLFFTSCPDVCPGHMATLAEFMELDTGARVLSISVDPETDTPERLADYAARLGADPARWVFLTGRPDILRRVLEGGFLSAMGTRSPLASGSGGEPHGGGEGTPPLVSISHATHFLVVDRDGWIRGLVRPDEGDAVAALATLVEAL